MMEENMNLSSDGACLETGRMNLKLFSKYACKRYVAQTYQPTEQASSFQHCSVVGLWIHAKAVHDPFDSHYSLLLLLGMAQKLLQYCPPHIRLRLIRPPLQLVVRVEWLTDQRFLVALILAVRRTALVRKKHQSLKTREGSK